MHRHTKFSYQNFSGLEHNYCLKDHSLELLTFTVTLTMNTAKQSFVCTRHPSLWWYAIKLSWLLKDLQLKKYRRNSHILIVWVLTETFTLKLANQSSWHSGSRRCLTTYKFGYIGLSWTHKQTHEHMIPTYPLNFITGVIKRKQHQTQSVSIFTQRHIQSNAPWVLALWIFLPPVKQDHNTDKKYQCFNYELIK